LVATSRRVQRCRCFPFLWTKEWDFNSLSVKITIMAKLKTSKKESERIKKITDDFHTHPTGFLKKVLEQFV
jgi:hypothetical protein